MVDERTGCVYQCLKAPSLAGAVEKFSQSHQGRPAGCGVRLSHALVFLCVLRNSHDAPHSRISFLLAKPTSSVHGERGSRKHSGPGLVFVVGAECKRENGKK